jgi:hypothetical protein
MLAHSLLGSDYPEKKNGRPKLKSTREKLISLELYFYPEMDF